MPEGRKRKFTRKEKEKEKEKEIGKKTKRKQPWKSVKTALWF